MVVVAVIAVVGSAVVLAPSPTPAETSTLGPQEMQDRPSEVPREVVSAPTTPRPGSTEAPTTAVSDRPAPERTPKVLPEAGSGEFRAAAGSAAAVGVGTLVTYQVEVEREVPLSRRTVAATVDRALLDRRGWTATGAHALERVETGGDVRVLLATPRTTDALCAPLQTGGRLSCRNGDLVVLNAWRWLNGADAYADDLRNYRRYLVNHEVGHALGNAHEACPGPGAAAPVMMQQTKGVGECVVNPWPAPR